MYGRGLLKKFDYRKRTREVDGQGQNFQQINNLNQGTSIIWDIFFSLNFFCILCKILGYPLLCNWGTPAPPSPNPWIFPFTPSIGRNNLCLSFLTINGEKHWWNKMWKFIFTTQFIVIAYLKIKTGSKAVSG